MFTFDLIINPIVVLAALIGGVLAGLVINKGRVAKKQARIAELESEMMRSHAEILEMQKTIADLERQPGDPYSPVISMKINGKDSSKEKASNK